MRRLHALPLPPAEPLPTPRPAARLIETRAAARREKELEQELAIADKRRAQAERLAAVGRVATGVAHEINNPLAYLRSNLELIAETARRQQDHDLVAMVDESLEGVLRIAQIVSDLSGFAREPGGRLAPLHPEEAITSAMRLASVPLRRVKHLEIDLPPDLPIITSQPGRLVQILVNLLVNAAEALEDIPDSRVRLRGSRTASSLRFEVDDNGHGVPPHLARAHLRSLLLHEGRQGNGHRPRPLPRIRGPARRQPRTRRLRSRGRVLRARAPPRLTRRAK